MQLQPYLFFEGRCEEAIEFYRRTLGAEVVMLMRYKDNPQPQPGMIKPGTENQVMHAHLNIGGQSLLLSDGQCSGQPNFSGFQLSLTVPSEDAAKKLFAALSEGGQVRMPLAKTFWTSSFGMLVDKFGVGWMVSVEHK